MVAPMLDTCVTHHLTSSQSKLQDPIIINASVRLATNTKSRATAKGKHTLATNKGSIPLNDAICVPNLNRDLILAGRLSDNYDILSKREDFSVSPHEHRPPECARRRHSQP